MRRLSALAAGITLAMTALPAAAGVVITQKVHMTNGANSRDSEQTISLQGNKQKLVDERHTIILDLDKGMMYALDPKAKSYFEIEFPAKGPQAAMMAEAGMGFKKAATTHEIADYRCTDYDGSMHVMAGDYTVKECFSTSAPGAEEFAAFEKNMAGKLKSAGNPHASGEIPGGVPLASDAMMKMGKVNIAGMAPEEAAGINERMAKRPPIRTTFEVEKIESKRLADSDFLIPSDFTKRDLPAPDSMKMSPGTMKMAPPLGGPNAGASPAAP